MNGGETDPDGLYEKITNVQKRNFVGHLGNPEEKL